MRESGRPEAVTLWTDPKKDAAFSKAMKENRIITVHTHPAGHKKDYGEIGFHEERGATYLVFPRTLPRNSDSRIVGINYQLAEDAPVKGPVTRTKAAGRAGSKTKKKAGRRGTTQARREEPALRPPKPVAKSFNVIVRRTAVLEDMERVKAFTEEEARQRALQSIKHKRFVLSRAVQRDEVLSTDAAEA